MLYKNSGNHMSPKRENILSLASFLTSQKSLISDKAAPGNWWEIFVFDYFGMGINSKNKKE